MGGASVAPNAERTFDLVLPGLTLESGAVLEHHCVRGWIAAPERDLRAIDDHAKLPENKPTKLLIHTLTGDMRAGGPGGFWDPLVGRGRPFDHGHQRIVCFNHFGSCFGTSGPRDADFPRDEQGRPSPVTTWDQARSILLALDALGVGEVGAVVGGSLGGSIALSLAVLAPERFRKVVPIAAAVASTPWQLGWNHIARQVIAAAGAERGLELARQIGMLSYRANDGLHERLGRGMAHDAPWSLHDLFAVGSYLEYQGRKLRDRFDAESYLLQLGAMDHHDLSRRPDSPGPHETWSAGGSWGLDRIRAPVFAIGIDSDTLYPPSLCEALVRELTARNVPARFGLIRSPHGHDAFHIEWRQLTQLLDDAFAWSP